MQTNDDTASNIAANVQALLDSRQWSVRRLAKATGDPHMTIVNAISGEHTPNAGILARIAEALDVTMDQLASRPTKSSRKKTG